MTLDNDMASKKTKYNFSNALLSHKREFPGGPVVRTQHVHCQGLGEIPDPWWGTKIPQAARHNHEKKERKKKKRKKKTFFLRINVWGLPWWRSG